MFTILPISQQEQTQPIIFEEVYVDIENSGGWDWNWAPLKWGLTTARRDAAGSLVLGKHLDDEIFTGIRSAFVKCAEFWHTKRSCTRR